MPEGSGNFDLVILSHVLEHVADLQSTIRDVTSLLSEHGRCYAEVPDASRYAEFVLAPFQDFNTEHINHFGLSALRNLFVCHGFTEEGSGRKEIESSPGCPYPAAYAFFRRVAKSCDRKAEYELDESFRRGLLDYIRASKARLLQIEQKIAPLCAEPSGLMVWGTGQLTMKLMAETSLRNAKIHCFIDSNPINHGKALLGIPIIAPSQITDFSVPILLATLLHHREIGTTIRNDLRLPNPIVSLDESLIPFATAPASTESR